MSWTSQHTQSPGQTLGSALQSFFRHACASTVSQYDASKSTHSALLWQLTPAPTGGRSQKLRLPLTLHE